jgi:hypothetical protein
VALLIRSFQAAGRRDGHDLDAVAGLIHEDYRSEQPAHPGWAFAGRAQMLAGIPRLLRRDLPVGPRR